MSPAQTAHLAGRERRKQRLCRALPGEATLLQDVGGVVQAWVGMVASVRAERLPAASYASTPSLGLCPQASEPNTKLVPVVLETRVPLR